MTINIFWYNQALSVVKLYTSVDKLQINHFKLSTCTRPYFLMFLNFRLFSFCGLAHPRKYFNRENFSNYSIKFPSDCDKTTCTVDLILIVTAASTNLSPAIYICGTWCTCRMVYTCTSFLNCLITRSTWIHTQASILDSPTSFFDN